jgi:hypothetical protein
MAMHDGVSDAIDPELWLTAEGIAGLTDGRFKANTVRAWWRTGALPFETFPELGPKSNKRSRKDVVERFLRLKLGADVAAAFEASPSPAPFPTAPPEVSELVDTLSAMKAAADSAMQALIAEAEHHAQIAAAQAIVSRAQAEADAIRAQADAKRVETLKHLQNTFRGYDMALSTYLQPDTLEHLDAPRATISPETI